MRFRDRLDAGRQLAELLVGYRVEHPFVIALPRGGVPVGRVVADELRAPLGIVIVRKVGVPTQPELAMGAVGPGEVVLLNEPLIARLGIEHADLEAALARERAEVARRTERYGRGRPPPDVRGRTVLLVDDGIATGSTALVAVEVLRHMGAAKIALAVPVVPSGAVEAIRGHVDDFVFVEAPEDFYAIGEWYEDFRPVSDEEVLDLLETTPRGSAVREVRP